MQFISKLKPKIPNSKPFFPPPPLLHKMEKCKRIERQLPEAMIQHIQSYLSGKEAARTTLVSKSWHTAWLTRPTLVFDERDFENRDPDAFKEFAVKTIQRYQGLNLKIESFALHTQSFRSGNFKLLTTKLIVDAVKLGATHLDLSLPSSTLDLPREVLDSETLLRLSVKGCVIRSGIESPMLKSLAIEKVGLSKCDMLSDIIPCCNSIEELSLSNPRNSFCRKLVLSGKNQYELHKLKRLYLEMVGVDNSFFENFGSRFPCLNDLSLVRCGGGYKVIRISSTSLQRISLVPSKALRAEFDVPNLASFSYSGKTIPSLSIEAMKKNWESSISIKCDRSHTSAWYLTLLKMLTRLSSSRISLSLDYVIGMCWNTIDDEVDFELPSKPVAVENLTIEAPFASSGHYLLAGLFWICQPKFVNHYWLPRDSCKHWMKNNESLNHVCHHLSHEVITTGGYDREGNLFGRFDIEEVNVQVYEEVLTEWKPFLLEKPLDALIAPPNKRKVRFGLKWTAGIALERI